MRNDYIKVDWEYTDAFKAELYRRHQYYEEGGRMISAEEANEQISKVLQGGLESKRSTPISLYLKTSRLLHSILTI